MNRGLFLALDEIAHMPSSIPWEDSVHCRSVSVADSGSLTRLSFLFTTNRSKPISPSTAGGFYHPSCLHSLNQLMCTSFRQSGRCRNILPGEFRRSSETGVDHQDVTSFDWRESRRRNRRLHRRRLPEARLLGLLPKLHVFRFNCTFSVVPLHIFGFNCTFFWRILHIFRTVCLFRAVVNRVAAGMGDVHLVESATLSGLSAHVRSIGQRGRQSKSRVRLKAPQQRRFRARLPC